MTNPGGLVFLCPTGVYRRGERIRRHCCVCGAHPGLLHAGLRPYGPRCCSAPQLAPLSPPSPPPPCTHPQLAPPPPPTHTHTAPVAHGPTQHSGEPATVLTRRSQQPPTVHTDAILPPHPQHCHPTHTHCYPNDIIATPPATRTLHRLGRGSRFFFFFCV